MQAPLSLHHAARLTGIEPSRLQFIGREFREFLSSSGNEGFSPSDFAILQEIHEGIFQRGEAPDSVRQGLRSRNRRLLIVAVTSGKGGVGKTTISVNLAVAFAQHGGRVLLLDADLGMANVHVFAGIQPRATLLDLLDGRCELAEAATPGPAGIDVICGPSGITRMADLDPRRIERLGRELAQCSDRYDVLLLDTGAGISAQVMQFLALAEEIVVVATPNLASTLDAYGVVKVMHERRLPGRVHVLVNQADSAAQADAVLARIGGCARQFLPILAVEPRLSAARSDVRGRQSKPPPADGVVARARIRASFPAIARQLLETAANADTLSCTAAA